MMKYIEKKSFFTTKEVAQLLGVTPVTIFRYIKNGLIKAELVGKTYCIPQEEVGRIVDVSPILSEEKKKIVKQAVEQIVLDYGEALRMLGKE